MSEKWIFADRYAWEYKLPLVRLVDSAGGSVKRGHTTIGKRSLSFACSIRSFELETKFHQMWRGPSIGAPPQITKWLSRTALSVTVSPGWSMEVRYRRPWLVVITESATT